MPSKIGPTFVLLCGGAVLALASHAHAEDAAPPAQVRFELVRDEAAANCPDQPQLEGAVAARLGYVPFVPDAQRSVRVHITRSARGLQAELRVSDAAPGTQGADSERVRKLASRDRRCGDLTEALVLAISLAIDPLALSRPPPVAPPPAVVEPPPQPPPPPPAPPPPPPPVTPQPPPPAEPVAAPPPPEPTRELRVFVSVAPHLVLGAEPQLSGGALIGAGVRLPRASFGVEARFDVAQSTAVQPQGEVEVGMRGAGLVGCFHAGLFMACGLAQLLAVQAEGHGAPEAESAVGLLTTLGARVGVEWRPIDWLWLRPAVEVQVAAGTIELVWLGNEVWATSRVQGLALLAIGADL